MHTVLFTFCVLFPLAALARSCTVYLVVCILVWVVSVSCCVAARCALAEVVFLRCHAEWRFFFPWRLRGVLLVCGVYGAAQSRFCSCFSSLPFAICRRRVSCRHGVLLSSLNPIASFFVVLPCAKRTGAKEGKGSNGQSAATKQGPKDGSYVNATCVLALPLDLHPQLTTASRCIVSGCWWGSPSVLFSARPQSR